MPTSFAVVAVRCCAAAASAASARSVTSQLQPCQQATHNGTSLLCYRAKLLAYGATSTEECDIHIVEAAGSSEDVSIQCHGYARRLLLSSAGCQVSSK